MSSLVKCCLGPPAVSGADSESQSMVGRVMNLAKETSFRRRSAPVSSLPQACATACASLPILSCDQWPQRIVSALANLEASLRCSARIVMYSSEGLPWVFAPIDWLAEESDRITLTHLADVLAHQADDAIAVVQRSTDPSHGMYQIASCSPSQALVMEAADHLALPLCQPGAHATAALLLSWDRPAGKAAWNLERHDCNTFLSAPDVKELRRLAQFLGYGLLGDPKHSRYVQRVCRHLALMPSAPSLHDLILTLLDGIHDLLLTKFGIQFQSVLTVVHGAAAPAVLFARRPSGGGGGGGGLLRPCGSDVQAQMSALLNAGGSTSGGPSPRANGDTTTALDITHISGTPLTASGGCVRQEPSRVRAIKTSLAHTLLLQASKSICTASQSSQRDPSTTRDASVRHSQLSSTNDGGSLRGGYARANGGGASIVRACITGPTAVATAAAAAAMQSPSRAAALIPVIVPNASSHVLEDEQPCRDILLCCKLTGGKAGSILLMTEATPGTSSMTAPEPHALSQLPPPPVNGGYGSAVASAAAASAAAAGEEAAAASAAAAAEEAFIACTIRRSGGGGVAAAAPLAANVRQLTYQLGLYLVSSEVLPAGVLAMIADELQALLLMFFGAWRTALAGSETSSQPGMAADWRRLQGQLLGQAVAADAIGGMGTPEASSIAVATAAVAGGPAAAAPLPTPLLESASPLSPIAPGRSTASNRLFKCIAPSLPVPSSNAPSIPTASCGICGGLLSAAATPTLPAQRDPLARAISSSQGGLFTRKGPMVLLAPRDEAAAVCASQHAQSMPGSGTAMAVAAAAEGMADASVGGLRAAFRAAASGRPSCSHTADGAAAAASASSIRTGSATPLQSRSPPPLHLDWTPSVTLEKPAGASALDMLVTSMRQGLTAAGADEQEEQALQAQDLAAVQLLDVLGRGGQGVVFRGSLHGLETAVKVLTDPSSSGVGNGGNGGVSGGDGDAGVGRGGVAAAAQGEAAADGGDGGACSSVDTWDVDTKAGEARMRQAKRGAMEVAVIGTLSHPSIVQIYATFSGVVVVRCQYHDSPHTEMRLCYPGDELLAGKDPGPLNQVICLEYCDAGTLLTAARAGAFRLPFALPSNGPAFPALLPLYKSLLEVALALRYMHSRRLVHCDLKAANVLLKSSSRDTRGWTCKLSDFGCARMLSESDPKEGDEGAGPVGFRTAAPIGTLAYMAPECFIKNCLLTAAVDIYSFGILMWELLMCSTPYAGMSAKDIPRQVIRHHMRPAFHPLAPPDYCALAASCWSPKPEHRLTAMELVGELEHLLAAALASAEREARIATAASRSLGAHGAVGVGSGRSGAAAAAWTASGERRKLLSDLNGDRRPPPHAPAPAHANAPAAAPEVDAGSTSQEGLAAAASIQTAARRLLLPLHEQQQRQQQHRTPPTSPPPQQQRQQQQQRWQQQQTAAAPGHVGGACGSERYAQQPGCSRAQRSCEAGEGDEGCRQGGLRQAAGAASRTFSQGQRGFTASGDMTTIPDSGTGSGTGGASGRNSSGVSGDITTVRNSEVQAICLLAFTNQQDVV